MDLDATLELLWKGEAVSEETVEELCDRCRDIVCEEGNVIDVKSPVTICGDIHGQFFDMLELFKVGGRPPETKYVFLGDYVDRGFNSVETFLLLIALKVKYPQSIYLIRGNHESRQITSIYGFYDECQRKYGTNGVWKNCTDLFDFLTLAVLIDNKVFCVHGGLSPNVREIDDVRKLDRKVEVPHDGPMCDLLWSDPDESVTDFQVSNRGAGHTFGMNICKRFNLTNNLQFVCRAHQLVMEGYKWMFDKAIVTVWSAPNYCYRCNNRATVMVLQSPTNYEFKYFNEAPPESHRVTAKVVLPEFFI